MECRIVDLQDLAYGFLDRDDALRVRDHLDGCDRCRADFARLDAERTRLAGAAVGLSRPRERKSLLPMAFAAALLAGLLWLLIPREPAPAPVAVPAAQDKTSPKGVPDDEESIQKEIIRLDAALKTTTDEQERSRIKTTIGDLKIRLQRAMRAKSDQTAMKEKEGEPKKPVKGKVEPEPAPKMAINPKDVELRLQSNPDDVAALVDRATWNLDNGKPEPAMKDLERAITIKPDFAPAYLKRAIAHAMTGHASEAWADAKRGEQLDLKAGKMIDDTLRTLKKLTGAKGDRKQSPADLANQVATLRDRVEELRAMAANADLSAADRERAGRDAERVQAEIDRLTADPKKK
jgi:anti-sigma factor RsiW